METLWRSLNNPQHFSMMDVSNIFGFEQRAGGLRLNYWIKFENKNYLIRFFSFRKKITKLPQVWTFLLDLIGTWIKLECLVKTFNGLSFEYAIYMHFYCVYLILKLMICFVYSGSWEPYGFQFWRRWCWNLQTPW